MSAAEAYLPLAGLRVVVTRAVHQAEPTARAFREAGADVALLPLLELAPPPDRAPLEAALAAIDEYAWIVFTSANAVERMLGGPQPQPVGGGAETDRSRGPSVPPLLSRTRVASVGAATSEALRALGIEPDLEPADARAEGVAAELAPRLAPDARVLLPQATDARPVLERELVLAGARVDRVEAYAKRTPPDASERAGEIFGTAALGWVTFTSPSTARALAEVVDGLAGLGWPSHRRGLLAASIGPVTSDALRELGVEPAAEAASPGDQALVAAVVAVLGRSGCARP